MLGGDNSRKVEAGLPNITGGNGSNPSASTGSGITTDFGDGYGALYSIPSGATFNAGPYRQAGLRFDASRSNAIYGGSETVQPPAFALIPQIKF